MYVYTTYTAVRISGVTVEIRTEHFPNISRDLPLRPAARYRVCWWYVWQVSSLTWLELQLAREREDRGATGNCLHTSGSKQSEYITPHINNPLNDELHKELHDRKVKRTNHEGGSRHDTQAPYIIIFLPSGICISIHSSHKINKIL
jgi:hypothetical protein